MGEGSSPKETPELSVGSLEDLYNLQVHIWSACDSKDIQKKRTADGGSIGDKSSGSCLTKGRNGTKRGEGAVGDL